MRRRDRHSSRSKLKLHQRISTHLLAVQHEERECRLFRLVSASLEVVERAPVHASSFHESGVEVHNQND